MSSTIRRHATKLIVGLTAVVLLSACTGRRITTVVEDQTLQPGPSPAPAVETAQVMPPPAAVPEAPSDMATAEPSPLPAETPTETATPEPSPVPLDTPTAMAKPEPPSAPLQELPETKPTPEAGIEAPRIEIPSTPPPVEEVPVVEQPVAPPPPPKPIPPPPQAVADLSDIFFDFDQFIVRDEARSELEANARLLIAQPNQAILIEGHCDERGTSAYNLVLGERRAQAVKQYLQDLGVASFDIQITSYGKERPFCAEHSEACWQSNRRAHFSTR